MTFKFETMRRPHLVAHRGYASRYPENTLLALKEAIRLGIVFLEFDLQCCADRTPVLLHDPSLERTTGLQKTIFELSLKEVQELEVSQTSSFGDQFIDQGVRIPTLSEVVACLKTTPQVTAFVELKDESLHHFGLENMTEEVMRIVKPILNQCCLIAYDSEVLSHAQELGAKKIGWILKTWSKENQTLAEKLAPDVLICNHKKIPSASTTLWPGPWKWCVYEVGDPNFALELHARGVTFIETQEVEKMLSTLPFLSLD